LQWDWRDRRSPMQEKIQHFKDLNRCGRILLAPAADGAAIPLSVWPIVLARATTTLLNGDRLSANFCIKGRRTSNAIFHLLQGPALMQRRFDRVPSQAPCVGVGEPTTTSLKRPAASIDKDDIAKKGKSE
jgi:hypothetical protein